MVPSHEPESSVHFFLTLVQHGVCARIERPSAEVRCQEHVGPGLALLASRNCELGIARPAARKERLDFLRLELSNDVHERATGPDRRELARVPDEHESLDVAERVDQRRELFFGQHRALVHDHGPVVATAGRPGLGKVGAGLAVVALLPDEKLRQCLAGTPHAGLLFQAHAGLARGCEEQQPLLGEAGKRAEHPQQRRLARPGRANQHGEPRAEEPLERRRLLAPRALLQLALLRILGQRRIEPRVHEPTPVEIGRVRLPLLPAEHLATDDLAALDEPLQLVGGLARACRDTRNDRIEALLAGVEHVLAERARRLERVLPRSADDPPPGQQRVPLGRRVPQEVRDQCAHAPFMGRVFDAARLRQGELLPHRFVREQAPVHRAEGDGVGGASVALEEEVRIAQQLGVARLDTGLRPRRGVVHAERLILRDGAAAEELEQGSPIVGEALPAPAQSVREELRHGPAEPRGIIHHGVHERPRITAALALAQQLDLVGEQASVLEAPLVAECRERRSQAGERTTRLPEPVELRVDPGERLVPRSLDPAADPVQRPRAGHEGGHGAIVGQELRAVRVGVEVLVRSEGHELLGVDRLALGEGQRLLVGKEETVRGAGPYRVAHVVLPEHAAQGRALDLVCVLGGLPHGKHAAHADDHAPGLLGERGALGIEEAERLHRPERAEEGVEQRELVLAFLDPGCLDLLALVIADVGLAVRHPADLQTLGDPDLTILRAPLDLLAQHPSVGDACRGVRRLHEAGGCEVAVGLGVELRVRVRHCPREREGRHERDALADTGRKIGAVELVEPPAGATRFYFVAPALADAGQD